MKTIELQKAWIIRLKYYTDRVRNTQDLEHKMAVVALLGYLESIQNI